MPFAIELLFDPQSDESVRKLGNLLEKKRIPTILNAHGASPHVTLAVFEKFTRNRVIPLLTRLAKKFDPIPFSLSSLGSFPGPEKALFLAPVVTPPLIELHQLLHSSLRGIARGAMDYYRPGQWMPHCTLSMGLSSKEVSRAFEYLQGIPFIQKGLYRRLALAEYHPVKEIYSVPLAKPKG
jgi:2'-5' RNA ligase